MGTAAFGPEELEDWPGWDSTTGTGAGVGGDNDGEFNPVRTGSGVFKGATLPCATATSLAVAGIVGKLSTEGPDGNVGGTWESCTTPTGSA